MNEPPCSRTLVVGVVSPSNLLSSLLSGASGSSQVAAGVLFIHTALGVQRGLSRLERERTADCVAGCIVAPDLIRAVSGAVGYPVDANAASTNVPNGAPVIALVIAPDAELTRPRCASYYSSNLYSVLFGSLFRGIVNRRRRDGGDRLYLLRHKILLSY